MKISDEAAMADGRGVLAVLGGSVDLTKGDVREQYGRAALEAARPYLMPDREVLIQVVAEYIDDLDNVPPMGTPADHLERRAVHVADAVLALLIGCLGDGVCTNPKCPVHGIKEEES